MSPDLALAHRAHVALFLEVLTPEVKEIIRLDLIQAVGNAIRYHARRQADLEEINQFVDTETGRGDAWGAF